MAEVRMKSTHKVFRRVARRNTAKGDLIDCWWECKLAHSLWKTVWRLGLDLPNGPARFQPSGKWMSKRHLRSHVYHSISHDSHKKESARFSPVNKHMNNMCRARTHTHVNKNERKCGMYTQQNITQPHTHKKEQNLASCWVWLVASVIPVLERTWAKIKSRPVWATGDTVEIN